MSDPLVVNIDASTAPIYERLFKEGEEFKNLKLSNPEQFLLAMALGFAEGTPRPLQKKQDLTRIEYFKDYERAYIESVAVFTKKSVDILANPTEVFKIAEAYANEGIRLLKDKIDNIQYGNFWKHFEVEITEKLQKQLRV